MDEMMGAYSGARFLTLIQHFSSSREMVQDSVLKIAALCSELKALEPVCLGCLLQVDLICVPALRQLVT
jgi:hypothetical protein